MYATLDTIVDTFFSFVQQVRNIKLKITSVTQLSLDFFGNRLFG